MLEYDRIKNVCEETSRECSLCKFYYFLDKNLSMDHIYVMVVLICL